MKNYLVTFVLFGETLQSVNVEADKVYVNDGNATFYRHGSIVASFGSYLRFIEQ